MSDILTAIEDRAVETIIDQTDEQLKYTVRQFKDETGEFEGVDYILIPRDRIAFPVRKDFFISAVLAEINYRELL